MKSALFVSFVPVLVLSLAACSGAKAPVVVSPKDAVAALCAVAAVRDAGDPRQLKAEEAVELALRVAACFPKAPAPVAADAGTDGGR